MKFKNYLLKTASAVMIGVIALSTPLYAAEAKPVLKVEDAIKSAIAYSNEISINSIQYEALKEQLKLNDTTYYQHQTIYLTKAKNEQQRKVVEDTIAHDIRTKYTDMLVMQKEISTLGKNIDIGSKELIQMSLKNKKGLVNPVLYQSKEIEVGSLKATKLSKEEELKNAQVYFKVITGKDVAKYTLDETISYEPFRIKGSVEGYINSKIEIYLQYDKELSKLKEDNVLREGDAPPTLADYLAKKGDAKTTTLKLEETQKNLKQSLITSYSALLSLEEQISSAKLQIDLMEKKLKSAELRYNAGMISVVEYDKQVVAKQEAELSLAKLINKYNGLSERIEKPWVAAAGDF